MAQRDKAPTAVTPPLPHRAPTDETDERRTESINHAGPNMRSWQQQQTPAPVAVECSTPEMPPIASSTQALEQDALLDALLFMDDFDLSGVDLTAADKPEAPVGPFCSELLGVDPIDNTAACSPAHLRTTNTATSIHTHVEETPRASPTPSSPPASVTSSASPPASPSTGSDVRSTASSSPTKRKGVVNHSRNRRREELQYLRSLVGELEDRLSTLHRRVDEQQQHNQKRQLTNGEDAASSVDDPVLTSVWETLASRQYAQRQRAEGENNKLRRMLEDQIQVGKSLERLLKRRHNADDLDMYLHGKRPRWTSTKSLTSAPTQWNKAAIYDELLATLPVMYDELQSVFQKIQLDRSPVNFRDIQVRNDPEQGVVIDVMESYVYPFDYALTSQHFWALFCSPIENERLTYHDADCDEDTLKVQFGGAIRIARAHGKINMKLVSRRYVEANRTVIVWVGLCDPTEIAETSMEGIYMRYKGWNIIEPLVAPAAPGLPSKTTPSTAGMGTRIKSYSYGVPEAFEDIPDQKRKVGTLTNFMLSTLDVQSSARQQQLENTLVELSLR